MQSKLFILGSQSPRRKQLLESMDIKFEVKVSNVDEIVPSNLKTENVSEYLAKLKADSFSLKENEILITADSIVILDSEILNKPESESQAIEYLNKLSNSWHLVHTGVCITSIDKQICFKDETKVLMSNISEDEIDYYLNNYNAFDKAGGYGIQDWIGWTKVSRIEGSYSNVMGLPTAKLYEALKDFI